MKNYSKEILLEFVNHFYNADGKYIISDIINIEYGNECMEFVVLDENGNNLCITFMKTLVYDTLYIYYHNLDKFIVERRNKNIDNILLRNYL